MIALRPGTLLNIDESKQFKKGAYRFWGCIPKYNNAAAKVELRKESQTNGSNADRLELIVQHYGGNSGNLQGTAIPFC